MATKEKMQYLKNQLQLEIAQLMALEEEGVKFIEFAGEEESIYARLNLLRQELKNLMLGNFHLLQGYNRYYLR